MAPVPKVSDIDLLQPKQVDIFDDQYVFPAKGSSQRPQLEKMLSCDFSVEVSSESSEDEEICPWTPKSSEDKAVIAKKLKFLVELQEKPVTKSDEKNWKLGALDQAKTRSPTENDDYTSISSTSPSKDAIGAQCGSSCSKLGIEEKKPYDGELSENILPKKKIKKRKGKAISNGQLEPKPKAKKIVTSEKNGVIKCQSIGKKKRNTYEILCPDTKSHFPKKIKVQRKVASKKQPIKLASQERTWKSVKKSSTTSEGPSGYDCVDSGVSTGNSYSSAGSSDGGSYSDSGNGRSCCGGGGGGGFYQKGGLGGNGGDENEDKKPLSSDDVNMEDDSDPWKRVSFKTQHLQHSAYCRNDSCGRPLCKEMKGEVLHIESHNCTECHRCQKTLNLMKYHAGQCKMPFCRVYQCNALRENKDVLQEPVQVVHQAPPPPQQVPIWKVYRQDIDGLLVYNNTGTDIKGPFQETINYIKGSEIGKGANGHVYKAHFPPSSPLYDKPMVVKETEYPLSKEELNVYKIIGDHPNIVKHDLVVMRGHDGHVSIFMEECDMSLKDLCEEHNMDDKEAIFYWHQVVDAVKYIHEKGIIHKDIKAQNVLVSGCVGNGEQIRAKLADMDSAKILENEYTDEGLQPKGTRGFASPEVMQRLPHGRPADIYSLGCLLMELKGVMPKENELVEQITKLAETNPFVGHLVKFCVQQDPFNRPTAAQIQAFLQAQTVPDAL